MTDHDHAISDVDLTAYIDGEASADLRARVEAALAEDPDLLQHLTFPMEGLQQGFAPTALGAPAMPVLQAANTNGWPKVALPLALAASLACGLMLASVFRAQPTWVDTVASYQALYVTETLAGGAQPAAARTATLARAEALLGIDLSGATQIEGLEFARVQVLAIEGEPLIQMAYLDAEGRPFAFCLTRLQDGDSGPAARMSHNLATTTWVEGGIGFVVVGGQDLDAASDVSEQLRAAI
jgi:anti-sigma factor RsiW